MTEREGKYTLTSNLVFCSKDVTTAVLIPQIDDAPKYIRFDGVAWPSSNLRIFLFLLYHRCK